MATAAYRAWVKAGRPWHIANIVNDYRVALHDAGWAFAELGTIGNEAHLQAETPQDHTPFSATGWPDEHPYPAVLALDAMNGARPSPVMTSLVGYWLEEARADRTPWVKYINWQGQKYDVRNAWAPRETSGHYDHAHISFTTNWANQSVGSWPVTPDGGTDMDQALANTHIADTWRTLALLSGTDASYQLEGEPSPRLEPNQLQASLNRLESAVAALAYQVGSPVDPQAIVDALAAHEGFISSLGQAIASHFEEAPGARDVVVKLTEVLTRGLGT
jgi:hypothetical protein